MDPPGTLSLIHISTSLNMAHNSNKLTKLDGQQNEIVSGPLIHRVGEPYYSYYVYEYAGVDAETGKEMFLSLIHILLTEPGLLELEPKVTPATLPESLSATERTGTSSKVEVFTVEAAPVNDAFLNRCV